MFDDAHVAKSPRFRAEPSTTADVIGENLPFETRALSIGDQSMQICRRVQHWNDALFFQAPVLALWLERKPIMGMRAERDDVRRFFDRWERVATENFDRNATGERRQI